MICTNCGSNFADNEMFCKKCGTSKDSIIQATPVDAPAVNAPVVPLPDAAPVVPLPDAAPAYPPQPPPPGTSAYPPQAQYAPPQGGAMHGVPPQNYAYGTYPHPVKTVGSGAAIASLVLGIVGLIMWLLPILGYPVTIVGLVLGIKGRKSIKRGVAIAGIILSSIGLFLTIVNSIVGAYLGATGQLFY